VAQVSKGIGAGPLPSCVSFPSRTRPYYSHWLKSVESAATALGVQVTAAPVRAAADVEAAMSAIAAQPNGGLVVQPDAYTVANRGLIVELAARYRLPAVYTYPRDAAEGGLISYGPDLDDLYRRSASYILYRSHPQG
jgi:putative ABC transport system substrate-binding protein